MANLLMGEKGQTVVEVAIVLPILLVILLGIIDFGRVFYAAVTISNASRVGARYVFDHRFRLTRTVTATVPKQHRSG